MASLSNRPERVNGRSPSTWELFWSSPTRFFAICLHQLLPAVKIAPSSRPKNPLRVVCISDTHGIQFPLPLGDLLIHAGDMTQVGTADALQATVNWMNGQPHTHKICIAGNTEECLYKPTTMGLALPDINWGTVKYLHNSSLILRFANGRMLRVFGSPYTPKNDNDNEESIHSEFQDQSKIPDFQFDGSDAFQYPRAQGQDVWAAFGVPPSEILVTHCPPLGHLDLGGYGCSGLLDVLWNIRPRLHVFGHIHAGRGAEVLNFDTFQRMFENIVYRKNAGVGSLLVMLFITCWSKLFGRRPGSTFLINAAIRGGERETEVRKPIVVDI